MPGIITLVNMAVSALSPKDPLALPITSGMDHYQRPFMAPGRSAAEAARRRPKPDRRASFDVAHAFQKDDGFFSNLAKGKANGAAKLPKRGSKLVRVASAESIRTLKPLFAKLNPHDKGPAKQAAKLVVPLFNDKLSREGDINFFATRIDTVEGILRDEMGWLALDGTRSLAAIGAGVASVISLAFGLCGLAAVSMLPGLGLIIFVGVMVTGVLLGVIAQSLARYAWRKRVGDPKVQIHKLEEIKRDIVAQGNGKLESLIPGELRQYRRIERIQSRLQGGFFSLLGDALIGLFGWDPRLGDLINRASKYAKRQKL